MNRPRQLWRWSTAVFSTCEAFTTTESSCKNYVVKHQKVGFNYSMKCEKSAFPRSASEGRGLNWEQSQRSEKTCSFSARTKRKLNSNNNTMAVAVNPVS